MKTYKTQAEVEADIVDGKLIIEDSVTFKCSIEIKASINARDINARDINARNINAWNINASDINALDINAWNISFYAVAFAYCKFICNSIKGRRVNSKYFCLDSQIEIQGKAKAEGL